MQNSVVDYFDFLRTTQDSSVYATKQMPYLIRQISKSKEGRLLRFQVNENDSRPLEYG
jgi:hypothetical protein